ncbi:hypothetical protein QJS10_CPA05g01974 [Acorus calamus]|uniref:Single-stranded DNA-binding protein, mitochondrial n=1 Tax=Acorus calamus TaxID=4465 RepID=A0AAV9ERW1_ACOCL|nr:hypothetical protein QJS10_CPA05g01974 [Acorus calamus]
MNMKRTMLWRIRILSLILIECWSLKVSTRRKVGMTWNFRGVHRAIICGKIRQPPVQKILRNGRTVTIFTVGTGGMFDQRMIGDKDTPKPAQWHRIAVHNDKIGAYAVRQLVKNSPVFVEGDIETRVYKDSINGQVRNMPEICVRRDGKVRLIKTGENVSNVSLDSLRKDSFPLK